MTQVEQMKMVLLYAMDEIGGGGKRRQVLQHINDCHYWYKNDANDTPSASRPSEPKWRNKFSYERQHLVEAGYMMDGGDGNWSITGSGKVYLHQLIDQAQNMSAEEPRLFTAAFYQKLFSVSLSPEEPDMNETDAEAHYITRVAAESMDIASTPFSLSSRPQQKPVPRVSGKRNIYPRDLVVARRALARAAHLCEADPSHTSFLRRNSRFLYMEPHHLIPISCTDYFGVNLDREQNIFSLCSNCHNQIHYGRKEDVRALISKLFSARAEELCGILGRTISVDEIYQIYGVS